MFTLIYDIAIKPISDMVLKPYLTAKLRVVTYNTQLAYAEKLLKSDEARKAERAIAIFTELGYDYAYRRQEIVDRVCGYLRHRFPQEKNVGEEWLAVLKFGIRSITSIPRYDVNGQPLNIDLRQMRIQSIDLTGINLKDVSMWGCIIHNVEMPRANLENADIGGTVFEGCSLEWCNFKKAKLNASFMDQGRPTTFRRTRLWGSNLHEAVVDLCHLHNSDGLDLKQLQSLIQSDRVKLISE